MKKTPIGMLVSGGGRTVENMAEACLGGTVQAQIVGMVSSSPTAYALERAKKLEIPATVVQPGDYATPGDLGEASFAFLREQGAEWILFGGYMHYILPPADFRKRTLNIHPSLIPAFCGKGMYGGHVHRAVLDAGVEVTGCTVHFVDDQYDHGPIVHQIPVLVQPGDTVDSLADRVFNAESIAFPQALDMLLSGKARLENNKVIRNE